MRELATTHGNDMTELVAALAAGQPDKARRIAHTLKGTAATLGANGLSGAAQALEAGLREGGGSMQAAELQPQIDAVAAALQRIATLLGPGPGES
jgi:two-component system sensor histidine kinase/response regulator